MYGQTSMDNIDATLIATTPTQATITDITITGV